jgi:Fe-S cluster biosynthesis and repair protein YggX
MTRIVHCARLDRDEPGLDFVPWPGELGKRIYAEISKPAWAEWLAHQTMLINEYRLVAFEPKARQFLVAEMEKYFFGGGSDKPQGFVDPEAAP